MTLPAVGEPAPDIALPDEPGTVHRLADQRGRWTILYFYPKDDTPGCTVEACEFRDANETITERGADVWGISPQDGTSKRKFREKFGLPFTLLADTHHEVAEAYGSWVEKQNYGKTYMGTARTDVPRRSRGRDRPGLAEGQARGPRRRGARRARHAASGGMTDQTKRLRSWGETSEASDHSVATCQRPVARRCRDPRSTWRPDRFMVIAAHPDDAEFGPSGTAATLDRRRLGRLARVLHERRPGRRGPGRRPVRAGGDPRGRAAGGGRGRRVCRRLVPAPARRRAGQRPRAARAAGPRDPDVPPRRRPGDAIPRRSSIATAACNHTDHRAAGMAAVDAVYPAARNPMAFPALARSGLAAHIVRRLYLFWSNHADA